MAGQPCELCGQWYVEPYHAHNARHLIDNPHAFSRHDHRPNPAGTECELCGLPAEPDDPEAFAEALCAAVDTLLAQVPGQVGWLCACRLRGPNPSECGEAEA